MRHRIRTFLAAAAMGCVLGSLGSVAAFSGQNRVVQSGKAFEPTALTVKAGETVTFVNDDFYDHNVYSESAGNVFNLGIQSPGQNMDVTFDGRGLVEVRCKIHPKMKLSITVE